MRIANSVHRGAFISSQAESITKNSFTLIIVHFCHLQSGPYLSLCSGSSIPGTGLLEFCVVMSAVAFLEMRTNHKGQSRVRKEWWGVTIHSGQKLLHLHTSVHWYSVIVNQLGVISL